MSYLGRKYVIWYKFYLSSALEFYGSLINSCIKEDKCSFLFLLKLDFWWGYVSFIHSERSTTSFCFLQIRSNNTLKNSQLLSFLLIYTKYKRERGVCDRWINMRYSRGGAVVYVIRKWHNIDWLDQRCGGVNDWPEVWKQTLSRKF